MRGPISALQRVVGFCFSFAVARVTGAVVPTLAAILSCHSHLKSLKVCLLGCDANDKGLGSRHLWVAQIRIHAAPCAATAAAAARAASTLSSAARHFLEQESWEREMRERERKPKAINEHEEKHLNVEPAHTIAMIIWRSEGMLSNQPPRRENDKIKQCHTRFICWCRQDCINWWIAMVKENSIVRAELT